MGGKTLKFPKRGKFVPKTEEGQVAEQPVSEEEHKARIAKLKELGLIKDENAN
jgi:hypothetical protein